MQRYKVTVWEEDGNIELEFESDPSWVYRLVVSPDGVVKEREFCDTVDGDEYFGAAKTCDLFKLLQDFADAGDGEELTEESTDNTK